MMFMRQGLCEVIRHRSEDARSSQYEALLAAQTQAEHNKKGRFKQKQAAQQNNTKKTKKQQNQQVQQQESLHVNDLSGEPQRAKAFLTEFSRSGRMNAVVEFVVNGARLKLFLVKQKCFVPFALVGVRAPQAQRKNDPSVVAGRCKQCQNTDNTTPHTPHHTTPH